VARVTFRKPLSPCCLTIVDATAGDRPAPRVDVRASGIAFGQAELTTAGHRRKLAGSERTDP
jgi:hypothetical protein